MLNIILLSFSCMVFYAGFLAGAKYKTFGEFYKASKQKVVSFLK